MRKGTRIALSIIASGWTGSIIVVRGLSIAKNIVGVVIIFIAGVAMGKALFHPTGCEGQ